MHKTGVSYRIHPFCSDVILMISVGHTFQSPSSLGLVLSSASTMQAYFVLRFPILRWVSPLLFIGILQGIAAGIGTSDFVRAAFIVSWKSSSFDSIKNIPLVCLALSSFGSSIAHLCFAFFFAASVKKFHISGHTSSGREVFCFLVSLPPDHENPSGGHPRSSNLQSVFPTLRLVMYVLFW